MPPQPNVQAVFSADVSLDPTVAGMALNLAQLVAKCEKYRADWVALIGDAGDFFRTANVVQPGSAGPHVVRAVLALESIAASLAVIASNGSQTQQNTETILAIQRGQQ